MTKSAAQELGPLDLRVNAVHPGGIRTISKDIVPPANLGAGALCAERVCFRWPLQRYPELREVANVILFLASDAATRLRQVRTSRATGGATIGPRYVNV